MRRKKRFRNKPKISPAVTSQVKKGVPMKKLKGQKQSKKEEQEDNCYPESKGEKITIRQKLALSFTS